jgi:hypothetical protein
LRRKSWSAFKLPLVELKEWSLFQKPSWYEINIPKIVGDWRC